MKCFLEQLPDCRADSTTRKDLKPHLGLKEEAPSNL